MIFHKAISLKLYHVVRVPVFALLKFLFCVLFCMYVIINSFQILKVLKNITAYNRANNTTTICRTKNTSFHPRKATRSKLKNLTG